nr:putative leucine-rich repeat receptor-like serine/threonine-protein kinase [Quercus suber]
MSVENGDLAALRSAWLIVSIAASRKWDLSQRFLKGQDLAGVLPQSLVKLPYLKTVIFIRNCLSGNIPHEWASSTELEYLDIGVNNVSGPIPSFLGSMTKLTYLNLSANYLTGELPVSLTNLTKLSELHLSFNRLDGIVPDFGGLKKLKYLYLASNLLTGPIPDWIKNRGDTYEIDLSYNIFLVSPAQPCRDTLNLFKSSSGRDNLILRECLSTPCSKDQYSLHINCGGKATTVGNIQYEDDEDSAGPAKFFHERENWGFSSTGSFWDFETLENGYIAYNASILTMNESELYTSARQSPLSFTYYARCLANGTYKVKLHFAEIVFRDNRSFYSLGRRIFDIYVQEKLVWEDFDIENSARGVDKAVVVEHTVNVTNKILMIRFYWAGKGTKAISTRGIYGPLISAISVESDFILPDYEDNKIDYEDNKMKISIVVGAIVLVLLLIFMILGILWWKGNLGGRISRENELKGLDLQMGFFTYRQIKVATNNFNAANKIGEGGFGSVYKGILSDGTLIAVKQLLSKSKQGSRSADGRLKLDWLARQKICVGIARGLVFLHEESTLKIVHRDIKTTNVLLDQDLNPKISDFGLAKLNEEENTHISTRIAGTM